MSQLLGLLLLSFAVTSFFMVPFIDFLFFLKRKYEKVKIQKSNIPLSAAYIKLAKEDEGTPQGGGILLIIVIAILAVAYSFFVEIQDILALKILLLTLISFGALGLVDDIQWILTKRKGLFLGLGEKYMFAVQLVLATFISLMLYYGVGLNNIYISLFGNLLIGAWYIPLSIFVIMSFSNAYNISDGLDGLSTGLLTICLFALLALSVSSLDLTLASFIGIWLGSLFAFLYFNVYPARIYLGNAGALAFGATLAVVGLLTGKILALAIIGGVYVVIASSSAIQMFSKRVFGKKVFPIAPIHLYFKYIGWEEPKIVIRFWLAGAVLALFGLWLSLLAR